MVKIRLKRMGYKKTPIYRVVVAESTSPRDGRFIESIGLYSPTAQPKELKIDLERATYWLSVGAQPSDTVAYLLRSQGMTIKGKPQYTGAEAASPAK